MTKVYDFSVTDIREHNFAFAEMTREEIADKKQLLEKYQKEKAASSSTPSSPPPGDPAKPAGPKPVFKPKMKPPGPPPST